ncbi:GntR family transcriptional regulator [Rhizobium sp. 2YAF20]|uniref:GntR family transcriptional regulator n=1 Tax=Rhizobium sp. 2YAF20 TaxID=3233027 RepID=UPI003F9A326D
MPLVRDNATTLYRQIAATLRDEIAGGRFNPSGRLPSEADIGARFGVSRVTVRLALDKLAGCGLIERRKGKGTYVAGKQVRHELDTLRSFHESLLLQGLKASMRILSMQSQATPPEIAATLGSGWETCLFVERLHLVDNEPIALGRSFLPAALQGLSRDEVENRPAYALLADTIGQDLERASVTLGAQSADRELESVLLVPRSAALLIMERTSYFADNVAAEHSIFYVRPERYRFAVNSFFQQADRARSN